MTDIVVAERHTYQERITETTMCPIRAQDFIERARARQRIMMDCACLEIETRDDKLEGG